MSARCGTNAARHLNEEEICFILQCTADCRKQTHRWPTYKPEHESVPTKHQVLKCDSDPIVALLVHGLLSSVLRCSPPLLKYSDIRNIICKITRDLCGIASPLIVTLLGDLTSIALEIQPKSAASTYGKYYGDKDGDDFWNGTEILTIMSEFSVLNGLRIFDDNLHRWMGDSAQDMCRGLYWLHFKRSTQGTSTYFAHDPKDASVIEQMRVKYSEWMGTLLEAMDSAKIQEIDQSELPRLAKKLFVLTLFKAGPGHVHVPTQTQNSDRDVPGTERVLNDVLFRVLSLYKSHNTDTHDTKNRYEARETREILEAIANLIFEHPAEDFTVNVCVPAIQHLAREYIHILDALESAREPKLDYTYPRAECPRLPAVQQFLRGSDIHMVLEFSEDERDALERAESAVDWANCCRVDTETMQEGGKMCLHVTKRPATQSWGVWQEHRKNRDMVEKLLGAFPALRDMRDSNSDRFAAAGQTDSDGVHNSTASTILQCASDSDSDRCADAVQTDSDGVHTTACTSLQGASDSDSSTCTAAVQADTGLQGASDSDKHVTLTSGSDRHVPLTSDSDIHVTLTSDSAQQSDMQVLHSEMCGTPANSKCARSSSANMTGETDIQELHSELCDETSATCKRARSSSANIAGETDIETVKKPRKDV
jgi:hypothetical protein